ncbi:MAG TPA: phosphoglucomutase (alpha-D-glucose-1,6-bisphosphate-dependent), partial [Polyangiaceae bacterium]
MSNQHELAGLPAPASLLVDVPKLVTAYYAVEPSLNVTEQRVAFGTSGHRGSSLSVSFNEAHILAITEAICRFRAEQGTSGPLFLGWDTHALSEPARVTALEVLAAHGVQVMRDARERFTPTPVVSQAVVAYNRGRTSGLADGIVVTPSHNPPEYGGLKYDPPTGGPAGVAVTGRIAQLANTLLADGLRDVARIPFQRAWQQSCAYDYRAAYVAGLEQVIDMDALRGARIALGVDPLGGASVDYWPVIAEQYGFQIEVVNPALDPTFRFMTVDWDGRIRMDPSSAPAMARLIALRERFDVAFATDPDADRHGVVTRASGLLNPNHYLAAAVDYLFESRPAWPGATAVGKTVVTSSIIDRVTRARGRRLFEVPVGFKYFVDGFLSGALGFGGEESAGASFLRKDGLAWSTDKDGIIMGLLAAELTARTGRDPGERYRALVHALGEPSYERIDVHATRAQKAALERVTPHDFELTELAGERVRAVVNQAPGTGDAIGGIKISTENGWFAARPSGTEDVYKLYAESFVGAEHLRRIQEQAQGMIETI